MQSGAIIGFGEVARNGHWPAYSASAEARIVAVVDRTEDRRNLARRLDPTVATFGSVDELAASSIRLDFVDICTPPALHAEPMLAAIERGWHVLCEKPFLLDEAQVAVVRSRLAQTGLAAVPVHNWKYAPIIAAATSELRAGTIGALRRVQIHTSRLREAVTADASRPNWRRDPLMAGGGILMDHGWHAVYLALHWFNAAQGSINCTLHRPALGGVEDEARVAIEFPGGEAEIALTWNGSIRRNTMTLVGDAGEIVIDDNVLQVTGAGASTQVFDRALSDGSHHADWFAAMLPEVAACFRDPARSRPLFEEAASCLAIIQTAYQCDASLAAPPR